MPSKPMKSVWRETWFKRGTVQKTRAKRCTSRERKLSRRVLIWSREGGKKYIPPSVALLGRKLRISRKLGFWYILWSLHYQKRGGRQREAARRWNKSWQKKSKEKDFIISFRPISRKIKLTHIVVGGKWSTRFPTTICCQNAFRKLAYGVWGTISNQRLKIPQSSLKRLQQIWIGNISRHTGWFSSSRHIDWPRLWRCCHRECFNSRESFTFYRKAISSAIAELIFSVTPFEGLDTLVKSAAKSLGIQSTSKIFGASIRISNIEKNSRWFQSRNFSKGNFQKSWCQRHQKEMNDWGK